MKPAVHVPWFNPREMDDATVLQLNTGREALLQQLFMAIKERLDHPGVFHHWLLTGVRGAGKSFFLRLVQASFAERFADGARFVLLPEEHRNIYAPNEFLAEIERMLQVEQGAIGAPPAWRVEDEGRAWNDALASLLASFPEPLLVVGVENFDELLQQAFTDETNNSRLRHLMSNEPRIMLVATAIHGAFDEDYAQRLFRQFEHHPIPPWDATDHRDYLSRRAERSGLTPSPMQLARIDAYSRYTGGNARAAAVLAGAILEQDDPLQAATDLDAAIEKMTDYYRALIERIPPKTRKLFDALIRGGDPASQTEIARRTGAQQNEISRAFLWLVDQGYVGESRQRGTKAKQYRVRDRLLVQFYRMRSVNPGQRSKLALMAELLADTMAFNDKWHFARRYADDGHSQESLTLVELALKERLVEMSLLPAKLRSAQALCELGGEWAEWDSILDNTIEGRFIEMLHRYPDDDSLRQAIDKALPLARAANRGKISGQELAAQVMASLSLCSADKLLVLIAMLSPRMSERQWAGLQKVFVAEAAEIVGLALEHPKDIEVLKALRLEAERFPRTTSLVEIAARVLRGRDHLRGVSIQTAADWAAQAARVWMAAGHADYANDALATCIQAFEKMADEETYQPKSLFAIVPTLLPILDRFTLELQAEIHEWTGYALVELSRYSDAYQSQETARRLRLETQQPGPATWNLEKMAWCMGQAGQTDQAITLHRLAWTERIEQQDTSSAAWCLGQLARHTVTRSGTDAAWALLDAELGKVAGQETIAIQQLGDAIADTAQGLGETAAFTLGKTLLIGLATRPQLVPEPTLRVLWIDMVEMAVPHSLLRELLDEWPNLFDYSVFPGLSTLNNLLRNWLDDLDTPAEQRAARRLTLDPDLATTLDGLAEALSRQVRQRLGLLTGKSNQADK